VLAGVVDSHDEVLEAVAGKRKQEPAATSASEYKEQQPLKKPKTAAPHLVAVPLPDTLIDDDERAAEQVATDVLSCNEVAQGDHEVSEDVLRARYQISCYYLCTHVQFFVILAGGYSLLQHGINYIISLERTNPTTKYP